MALATKCPHCNTIFRVAHDQLKLRGGIVRCGSCNEVFDGNAALLEPPAPPAPSAAPAPAPAPFSTISPLPAALPELTPFDEKMAALDTRAAETLSSDPAEPIYTLELDTAVDPADAGALLASVETDEPNEPAIALEPAEAAAEPSSAFALPAAPAPLPPTADDDLDLDLDIDTDDADDANGAAANTDAHTDTHADIALDIPAETDLPAEAADAAAPDDLEHMLNVEGMSDAELESALEAELAHIDAAALPAVPLQQREPEAVDVSPPDYAGQAHAGDDRREPTLGAAPDDAAFADDGHHMHLGASAFDDPDEEALVQLSSAGRAHAEQDGVAAVNAAIDAGIATDDDSANGADEPGFIKRDRLRQKYGKSLRIAMAAGSVLLLAALVGQGVTTFRNQLAAAIPPVKPALQALCATLGCSIELPAQIDDVSIEQGELQTLSETTFSFTTLLRNQGSTAQAWPHIELRLDDSSDKTVLRRVFAPRDYLPADTPLTKGFAPHTEQSVKLYFELSQLKASGYHIAVFYP